MGLSTFQRSRALRHALDDSPLIGNNGNSGGVLAQDLLASIRQIIREELGAAVKEAMRDAIRDMIPGVGVVRWMKSKLTKLKGGVFL